MRTLTNIERNRVRAVLDGNGDYHDLQSPEEWHQLALYWDWTEGLEPLEWITTLPQCDQGTALYLYWQATPLWFTQYADREEMEAAGQDLAQYDFLKTIEARYLRGFYRGRAFRFDPRAATNPDGSTVDLTAPEADRVYQRPIPQPMLEASPGEPAARQNLFAATLRLPNAQEHRILLNHLARGSRELQSRMPGLPKSASPREIVDAICEVAESDRAARRPLDVLPDDAPIVELDYVWADQLRRAYGWQWQAWDFQTGANIGIFSPNHQYGSFAPNFVKYVLHERNTPATVMRSLFDQLAHPQSAPDLREACERGWIMENPFYEEDAG